MRRRLSPRASAGSPARLRTSALESGGVLVGDDIKITMDLAVLQAEAAPTE